MPVLFSEAAAAFEELTLSGGLRHARRCRCPTRGRTCFARRGSSRRWISFRPIASGGAWPTEMARVFSQVDVLLVPSLRDEMLTLSNFTGHPSLTLRAGFVDVSEARSDWAPDPKNPLPTILAAAARAARRDAASADCSTKGRSRAPGSRWSGRSAWRASGRPGSEQYFGPRRGSRESRHRGSDESTACDCHRHRACLQLCRRRVSGAGPVGHGRRGRPPPAVRDLHAAERPDRDPVASTRRRRPSP